MVFWGPDCSLTTNPGRKLFTRKSRPTLPTSARFFAPWSVAITIEWSKSGGSGSSIGVVEVLVGEVLEHGEGGECRRSGVRGGDHVGDAGR